MVTWSGYAARDRISYLVCPVHDAVASPAENVYETLLHM